MMTPSYALTATERVLPNLALNFTTAVLDARVTITRASNTATAINSSGVIAVVNANLPRFDYNPTTLACRGLLIEEARTNVLLNSLINGTSLATQTVAMTAAARTLSFYGTGQIVLTGAHSATVTGTGAYPTRTTLTFTPTASNLTLTVTGTVQFAQLETGSFATSFIPTDGTSKTRNADNVQMTGANFTSWYNQSAGAAMVDYETLVGTAGNQYALRVSGGTNSIHFGFRETAILARPIVSSVAGNSVAVSGSFLRSAGTYDFVGNTKVGGANGSLAGANTVGTVGTNTLAYIGSFNGATAMLNGWMRKISYWPQKLTSAEVQAFSKRETP